MHRRVLNEYGLMLNERGWVLDEGGRMLKGFRLEWVGVFADGGRIFN